MGKKLAGERQSSFIYTGRNAYLVSCKIRFADRANGGRHRKGRNSLGGTFAESAKALKL